MKRLLIALFSISSAFAQTPFMQGPYDPSIPTPASVLGYEIGTRYTNLWNLDRYLDRLVAASNRITRVVYGETYEHRPLQLLIISTPEHLARLDEIRAANLKLTDPRTTPSKEAEQLINSLPAIVWLSYGVHGNESSSPEAALLTAYQLCAGTDERTMNILRNTIVLIDPVANPDGRERFVQWITGASGKNPQVHPEAYEQNEPWPNGRTNHYLFDLNRDWSWLTQRETQARIHHYRRWMPHVHVDFHEMRYTSTYFFFPAAVPIHQSLPPEVVKWGKMFGKANAEALNMMGEPYYVGELFDMFYPGFGDSWPTFNGAIGMTYEQAGQSGRAIRRPSGDTLTLRVRARNHFVTGMATLETTANHRRERLRDFYTFWESALNPAGPTKGFIMKEEADPNRAARMVNTLLQQGIEVHQLQSDVQLDAQRFYAQRSRRERFPKGTYFISLQQPHSRLALALLEPKTVASDTFFYDVSVWSLPVAYGLEAYTTSQPLPREAIKLTSVKPVAGGIVGGRASFAYLIPWERNDAAKLVWRLLSGGHTLTYALKPFTIGNRAFRAGTIIALTGSNSPSLHDDIERHARTFGIDLYAANTGLSEHGISLGSDNVRPLKLPSIAVITDAPVRATSYGELWYMFDQEYDIPFTAIRARDLSATVLAKYDVLILPEGGDYRTVFDSTKIAHLKHWVQTGGVLIGLQGGADFLTKNRSGITAALLETDRKDDEKTKEEKEQEKARKEAAKRETLFERQERERLEVLPGAIFKAFIDTTHPIGFGYPREIFVLKDNSTPLVLAEGGLNVGRFSTDSSEVSGYAPKIKASKVADSAFIIDFRSGNGRVVLITETVTFRMFWKGLERLLINSILFLPAPR